jgi:anti-anti-sigma factor
VRVVIEICVTGRLAVVALSGEFDLANSVEIRDAAVESISQGVTDVTVDLTGVTFFDVTAIDALVVASHLLSAVDGRMVVIGADRFTAEMLAVAGVDRGLPSFGPGRDMAGSAWLDEEEPWRPSGQVEDDLTDAFYALSQTLLSEKTLAGDLGRIARAAVTAIPAASAASVALVAQGISRTAATSDHVAIEVDIAQYTLDEGPCLGAVDLRQRVRVDMLSASQDYRHFASLAIEAGIQATLSVPITVADETVGSLNLYSAIPAGFGAEDEAMADILAAQAATAIHRSVLYAATRQLAATLQQRSDDQTEIAIAYGALSALHRSSIEQARHLLRDAADANHEDLARAARRIIAELTP